MRPLKLLTISLWVLAAASVAGYFLFRSTRAEVLSGPVAVVANGSQRPGGSTTEAAQLPVLYPMPAFSLTDQTGQTFSSEQLAGKVWVGFIFLTNCPTGACPVMVAKMAKLQESLPDERVHFVSLSVDPQRDTPEVLRAYAEQAAGGQVSSRWHLLTGTSRAQMTDLARSMKLIVDEEFGHSTIFLLVDGDGNLRGTFGNDDPDGMANLRAAAEKLLTGS